MYWEVKVTCYIRDQTENSKDNVRTEKQGRFGNFCQHVQQLHGVLQQLVTLEIWKPWIHSCFFDQNKNESDVFLLMMVSTLWYFTGEEKEYIMLVKSVFWRRWQHLLVNSWYCKHFHDMFSNVRFQWLFFCQWKVFINTLLLSVFSFIVTNLKETWGIPQSCSGVWSETGFRRRIGEYNYSTVKPSLEV